MKILNMIFSIIAIVFFITNPLIGCKSMALVSSASLDIIGVDHQIGLASIEGKSYGHYYIEIDDKPYEPRFLGLFTLDHINYDNDRYKTSEQILSTWGFFPDIELIIKAIMD